MRRMDSMRIVTLLGVLVLVAGVSSASAATEWTMDLSAEVEGITADLIYGINGGATDGYDDGLDANAPPADPSGFDAYFNEPGVGTGKLNANIKALGMTKDWTLIVVAPATKTVNVLWTSGDILSNVDMQMQELDLGTGEPTGTAIDMKAQNVTAVTGGAFAATTKAYTVTATTSEPADEPPELISCIIDPAPPAAQGTNVSIDCLFSETVDYEIHIENVTGLVELIGDGTAKNPDKKWWYTTTETPIGAYTVNVTMYNSTSGLSSYNDTNTIEITEPDTTTYYRDADGDTYGNASDSIEADSTPEGYVEDNTDCDDTNAAINPGTDEVCGNEIDDNCDGQVDEGCDVPTEWTMDLSAEVEGITADLIYGVNGGATDEYDDGLDANAPPADPSGFDAYFNEPGVGTGKLNANIKALGETKEWTLIVVAPATKTVNVLWTSGDILSNVDMQIQELDLGTGEPTGTAIDMKAQNVTAVTGGAFAATTKAYTITATTTSTADTTPPEITSVVLTPAVVAPNESISVAVIATDDMSGVDSVTANDETLTLDNGTWEGVITAGSVVGTYNVTVVATDAAGNVAEDNETTYEVVEVPIETTLHIPDVTISRGENTTVPITVFNVTEMSGCEITFTYDPTVVYVTDVARGDMNFSLEYNINNGSGWMRANALDIEGQSGNVIFAYVTLDAVGNKSDTSEMEFEDSRLVDSSFGEITHVRDNGTFSILPNRPPEVTNASATLGTILYDNGRPRTLGTNLTSLSAIVTDVDGYITTVTIDLSSIGGSPVQPMDRISGEDLWMVNTTATEVDMNAPDFDHQLTITATDDDGGINDSVSIELIVLKRGDVNGDGLVDKTDADYISRYLAGLEPEASNPPSVMVGDVIGDAGNPVGDGVVDLMDALYIAKYTSGAVEEP